MPTPATLDATSGLASSAATPASSEAVLAAMTFRQLLDSAAPEVKEQAVYLLLRSLLGGRVEREAEICDLDGFVYVSLLPPGRREALRMLEDPAYAARLQQALADRDVTPLREVLKQLQAAE